MAEGLSLSGEKSKRISGQRSKSKAMGMVIRFVQTVFSFFSIRERILLQVMARISLRVNIAKGEREI
jgi:hypothetical protein